MKVTTPWRRKYSVNPASSPSTRISYRCSCGASATVMATLSIVPRATPCATKADGGVDIQSRAGTAWVFHGCVDFTWLDADEVGSGDIAGAVALLEAAPAVDSPHQLPAPGRAFSRHLR